MAKIFETSKEGIDKRLDIFSTPDTNCSIEKFNYQEYRPSQAINQGSSIQIDIKSDSLEYIDLSDIKLCATVKIVDGDGDGAPVIVNGTDVSKQPGTITHLLQSLWNGIVIKIGNIAFSEIASNYIYRSLIKTLLYNTKTRGESLKLESELFFPDVGGQINNQSGNAGLLKSKILFQGGREVSMCGHLNLDVFKVNKYLINGVDLSIRLTPNKDELVIMCGDDDESYKLVIQDIYMLVKKVTPSPEIIRAHAETLKAHDARYYYKKTSLFPFSLPEKRQNFTIQDPFNGDIPEMIVIGIVSDQAYNGDYKLSPFNFANFSLQSLGIYVDGQSILPEYKMNYKAKQYVMPMEEFLKTSNSSFLEPNDFAQGYALYVFNLKNNPQSSHLFDLFKTGNLEIKGTFDTKLPKGVQVLVYGEFQAGLKISKNRQVKKLA